MAREALRELFALSSPEAHVRAVGEWKRSGRKAIGWLCAYVPEEIIHAAGMLPIRILGDWQRDSSLADSYLDSRNCPFTRSCLSVALEGGYDFLDGIVTTTGCDCMRRLFDNWRYYVKTPMALCLGLPRHEGEEAQGVYRKELARLQASLEELAGKEISPEALRESIAIYNRSRFLLGQLWEMRKRVPSAPFSGSQALRIILAGTALPRERYNELLERALAELQEEKGSAPTPKIRLAVTGSILVHPGYLEIMEELGGAVVVDDLCTGLRYFRKEVPEDQEPLSALSQRYLTRGPCAHMYSQERRLDHLRRLVGEFGAEAVVYSVLKFCDPFLYDYPVFQDRVAEWGLPLLRLEREYTASGMGQLRTRIEAFFEAMAVQKAK